MQTIVETRKIKEGWYNQVLERPLEGRENSNIQYILEANGIYSVVSMKPLTLEEVNNINLDEYIFKPLKEVMKEGATNDNN